MASVAMIMQRRRNRKARRKAARARSRLWAGLMAAGVLLLVVVPAGVILGGTTLVYLQAVVGLPSPEATFSLEPVVGPTRLYDSSGDVLLFSVQDPLGNRRDWIPLDDLPSYVAQATLLMEDPDFLTTTRFDPIQTTAKLWRNFISGPLLPDTTLTGRLVRNVILPQADVVSVEARAREIALVAEINRRYTPEKVLEWHLNTNYYGNEIYGIDAAAQIYLGKRAVDLTVDEAALLAAIPPAPQYNPVDDETAARGRQADVLRQMLAQGATTPEQYQQASSTVTTVRLDGGQTPSIAPEFAIYARRQAESILNALGHDGTRLVSRGGLRIVTSLDVDLYLQSECALRIQLARLHGDSPGAQTLTGNPCQSALYLPPTPLAPGSSVPDRGALVIIDPATGAIKSMVGSVTRSDYQPGPTLYPLVYFTAFLTARFNAGSMVLDIPSRFPGSAEGLIYTPANPDGKFHGPMNLRDAMGAGLLPPVVSVAQDVGISNVLSNAHLIGINSLNDGLYDLSLLERGGGVSALDIAYTYTVFADEGHMPGVSIEPVGRGYRTRDPVAILRIEDSDGKVLWEYDFAQTGENCTTVNCTTVFERSAAYIVNDILADQETRRDVLGPNNVLDLSRPAAVVNGLTGDARSDWTVGYTPQRVVAVHLDRSDGLPMTLSPYALEGAAPVWRALMEYTHNRDSLPVAVWERPADVVQIPICQLSGLLFNGVCPPRPEIFPDGMQRALAEDTYWQVVEVNSQNGRRATASTPAGVRSQKLFFIPPSEALDWWRANNQPLPPDDLDTITVPDQFSATQIAQPRQFDYVGGVVEIIGSMDVANLQYYQLSYGEGLNPERYFNITGQQIEYTPGEPLAQWDTTGLDGPYTLRLVVVLKDNSVDPKVVQVTVDNTAPTVTLTAGEPEQVFRWPDDSVIPLQADASDNFQIDRVEFFHNGQFVGTDDEWPYGFNWDINRTGPEFFSATVYDAVGNSASAEIEVQVQRSGG